MNMVPATTPTPQQRSVRLCIVPTPATRAAAARMVREATASSGPDAVLRLLPSIEPRQVPALLGVLLASTKVHKKIGRPVLPNQYTREDRLRALKAYRNGDRGDWAVDGYREYQRVIQRAARARRGRS